MRKKNTDEKKDDVSHKHMYWIAIQTKIQNFSISHESDKANHCAVCCLAENNELENNLESSPETFLVYATNNSSGCISEIFCSVPTPDIIFSLKFAMTYITQIPTKVKFIDYNLKNILRKFIATNERKTTLYQLPGAGRLLHFKRGRSRHH
jgi:hypothetical protein